MVRIQTHAATERAAYSFTGCGNENIFDMINSNKTKFSITPIHLRNLAPLQVRRVEKFQIQRELYQTIH